MALNFPTDRLDVVHPLDRADNDVAPSFCRNFDALENLAAMASDPFGSEHVPSFIVEYRRSVRERKERMYEVSSLRLEGFMVMLWSDGYAMFRRFNDMPVNPSSYM